MHWDGLPGTTPKEHAGICKTEGKSVSALSRTMGLTLELPSQEQREGDRLEKGDSQGGFTRTETDDQHQVLDEL